MILKKGWHVEFQGEEGRGGVSKETVVLREHNKKNLFLSTELTLTWPPLRVSKADVSSNKVQRNVSYGNSQM